MSKYQAQQLAEMRKVVRVEQSRVLYDKGFRQLTIGYLTIHVLIGTWKWFFFGCFAAMQYVLIYVREELAMNTWFIIVPIILLTAMLLMIGDSYRHAKRILRK